MKLFNILIIFLFCQLSYSQTFTKLKDINIFKEGFYKSSKEMNSLQVDVEETKSISILKGNEVSYGKLYYQQGDQIRWEMNNPGKNIFIFSNKTLKMMENGKEVKNPNQQQIGKKIHEMMLSLLSGKFVDGKMFEVEYFSNKYQYKLVCVPKNKQMKKNIQKLECYFDKNNFLCEKLVFFENDENKVSYIFSNPKVNLILPKNIFKDF